MADLSKGFIEYKKGYKYQLARTVEVATGIIPPRAVKCDYSSLDIDGILTLFKGFACDGPSGPTIDSPSFMAAAFCHDALYEMLRLGNLPEGMGYRKAADKLLADMAKANGMIKVRAAWVYAGVRIGAGPSSKPVNQRPVIKAPAAGWRIVKDEDYGPA